MPTANPEACASGLCAYATAARAAEPWQHPRMWSRPVLVACLVRACTAQHSPNAPRAPATNMVRTVPFSVWLEGWEALGARAARRVGAVWAAMWARNAPAPRPSSAARAWPGSRTLSALNGSARLRTGSTRSCARRSAVKTDLGARTHHGDTRGASGHPMRQSAGPWEGPPRHLGGARRVLVGGSTPAV